MRLTINGQPEHVPDGATIADLVRDRGLTGAACAVEVNRELAPRARHEQWTLNEGDEIEIVTLVGGG